ncbi:lipopolysaccharide biosynthesis protein [Diplocloster hominis]|uniref:lipopolysaccharide biosynthesis protein n=1 Tax=Diplocloster hominis TaxID=3079010 RepID=UPI0031BA22C5
MNYNSISKKQTGLNLMSNTVSYSANLIISFLLTPFLINALGRETYSFYPVANTIVSYMSILTNAMNSMASRFVTVSLVKGDDLEANKYYSSVLISDLIISIILLVPMFLFVFFIDAFMDIPINSLAAIKSLFILVFSSALINILATVFGIATFAKNRIDLRSIRELILAGLKLVLFFVLYKFFIPSIIYIGIVALAISSLNILIQIKYTKMLLPEIKISKNYFSWKHIKILFTSSIWNAINTLGNNLIVGMSIILANIYYGAGASGTYSIANTIPQFINGVITMLIGVFFPVITYKYALNDRNGLIKEIINSQKLVGILGCTIISVFIALSSNFFTLWTPGEDPYYLSTLSLISILPHFFITCTWTLVNLNVVMNKVKVPAIVTMSLGILNIIIVFLVNYLFKPDLISLPFISSSIQIISVGLFIPLYACKNLKLKWYTFYPTVIKSILCSLIIICFLSYFKEFFVIKSWFALIIFAAISGCIALCFISLIVLGPLNIFKLLNNLITRFSKHK